MANIAVVLSGCGYLDGSEIREAVIALLELDKAGHHVQCFAPNINQRDVVNHLDGSVVEETRNVLVESARIARGQVLPIEQANVENFDALVLPGGFGAAKNLSDLAINGSDMTVTPAFKSLVLSFLEAKKPIGAICISPAVLVGAIAEKTNATVTIGDDQDGLIEKLGGTHQACATDAIAIDEANQIISCPAYMKQDSLANVALGITRLVQEITNRI